MVFELKRCKKNFPSLSRGERVPEKRGRVRGYLQDRGAGTRQCGLFWGYFHCLPAGDEFASYGCIHRGSGLR